jgi:hypothetical protein
MTFIAWATGRRAIASLLCGIIGFAIWLSAIQPTPWPDSGPPSVPIVTVVLPVLAIVFGHIAKKDIARNQEVRGSKRAAELATGGLLFGYTVLVYTVRMAISG